MANLFSIFGIDINLGTLLFLFGLIITATIAYKRFKANGFSNKNYLITILLSCIFGLFLSHWLYSLLRFGYAYNDRGILYILLPIYGDFTMFGAFGGVILGTYISSKICKFNFLKALDSIATVAFIAILFERLAEGLWFQGYGRFVENELISFFPISIFDAEWEYWLYAVFAYEAIFALICSYFMLENQKEEKLGTKFIRFFTLYCSGQVIFESMRQDEVIKWSFVNINQAIAALILLAILIFYLITNKIKPAKALIYISIALIGFILIATMEFALEGRVPMFENFNNFNCYTLDLVAVLFINLSIYLAKGRKLSLVDNN